MKKSFKVTYNVNFRNPIHKTKNMYPGLDNPMQFRLE